jgi:disulfide bond formation protein DsbB
MNPPVLGQYLDRRRVNLLGFAACAGALAFALFAQYGLKLTPCHLCIFQRVEVLILGLVFLLAAIHNPGDGGARVYGVLVGVAALLTAVTAGRHVWIQMQPPGSVPGCGADLAFMLDVFPLMQVIIKVFKAGGECAKIDFSFLGISFPGWVLLFVTILGSVGIWGNWKLKKRMADGG